MRQMCIVSLATAALLLGWVGRCPANFITNGDFATGNFNGWTLFTTANGSLGDDFFYPKVVQFDTLGTGTPTNSAAFNVGKAQGGGQFPEEGGGLRQTVSLPAAGVYDFSAAIAVFSPSNNAEGGLFELLFDGTVVASRQFGSVSVNTTYRDTLTAEVSAGAGQHQVEIQVERIYGAGPFSTPVQYVTGVDLAAPVPEPSSLTLLGLGGLCLLGCGWRRWRAAPAC